MNEFSNRRLPAGRWRYPKWWDKAWDAGFQSPWKRWLAHKRKWEAIK